MSTEKKLTRTGIRAKVFIRDKYKCVVCNNNADDAHHLMEKRLFGEEGNYGYEIDNLVSLCPECHILAEQTIYSVEFLLEKAGIKNRVLPPQLYDDIIYTKWGDPIRDDGTRAKGELFYDESVQKILTEGGMVSLYTDYVKYPRTFHLPSSPGMTKDDRMMSTIAGLAGQEVIVTVKLDGECTTMYRDYIHARSLEYEPHPSRDRVKAIWGNIAHEIPDGWRVCGENLYAKHSIAYSNLPSYFMVFSIWNDKNQCLSWNETEDWCSLLGLETVPVIMKAVWNDDDFFLNKIYDGIVQPYGDEVEGYVVRVARSFEYSEFRSVVGKWVRKGHVQSSNHWKYEKIVPNKLLGV